MRTYRSDRNLVLLRKAIATTEGLVGAIRGEQWHAASACEEMDVLALVAHLVGGLDSFAAVPAGGAMAGPDESLPR